MLFGALVDVDKLSYGETRDRKYNFANNIRPTSYSEGSIKAKGSITLKAAIVDELDAKLRAANYEAGILSAPPENIALTFTNPDNQAAVSHTLMGALLAGNERESDANTTEGVSVTIPFEYAFLQPF